MHGLFLTNLLFVIDYRFAIHVLLFQNVNLIEMQLHCVINNTKKKIDICNQFFKLKSVICNLDQNIFVKA